MFVLKTTSFRGIRLKLTGTLRIKWTEMEAGSAIPYEEFESLLYENLDIFTPNLRDKDARWIFPGKHVYKFSYKLPTDIPYTLDGSRYGRVEYKSKAELLIPAANPVESQEEEFILRSRCLPEVLLFLLKIVIETLTMTMSRTKRSRVSRRGFFRGRTSSTEFLEAAALPRPSMLSFS